MKLDLKRVRPIARMALEEDVGKEDVTTLLTVPKRRKAKGVIRAKEKGIIAGLPVAELVFQRVAGRGSRVAFKARVKEGAKVKKGQVIAEVIGDARSILTGERTALNFLQRLSGIATLTNQFVKKVKPHKVKIFDTRKTTPGLRYLEKYAVRCGGGYNHRMGLWDMVLIKDNHLKIQNSKFKMQNLKDTVKIIRKRMPRGMKIEVEAKNLREVEEAVKAGVDIIMLDNMDLKTMSRAVRLIKVQGLPRGSRVPSGREAKSKVEVSGGITLENVRKVAKTGVDRISIGALTHSAQALDISLDIVR
ncbi:carboxylating nicotinate-nucleotide diphosphorylase [bacterium]|nr:carboxylating nicotinate-nucleotide diphosphorylase [bacterium]